MSIHPGLRGRITAQARRARFAGELTIGRLRQRPCCPYCETTHGHHLIQRRGLMMDILACPRCGLVFRYPVVDERNLARYYEGRYKERVPTELPSSRALVRLIESHFRSTPYDQSAKIAVLQSLVPEGRVLDFGAAWGYGVFQLMQAGYEAMGFEISQTRAQFAKQRLGLRVEHDLSVFAELEGTLDAVYSNHVLEHLGRSLGPTLSAIARCLRRGGIMFHVLPNFRSPTQPKPLRLRWIGRDHPIAPDGDFFRRHLPRHGVRDVRVGTSPFDSALRHAIERGTWDQIDRGGEELLVLGWV